MSYPNADSPSVAPLVVGLRLVSPWYCGGAYRMRRAGSVPRVLPIRVVLSGDCAQAAQTASLQAGLAPTGLWPATAPPTFFPGVCHAFARQEARLPPPSAHAAALRVQAGRTVA